MRSKLSVTSFRTLLDKLDHPASKVAFAVLIAIGVPMLRVPGLIKSPNLWAEDGALFLAAAWNHPGLANFATPYNGYLHTIPRCIAALAMFLPLQYIPTAFLVASWLFWVLPIFYFLFKPQIGKIETRIALAIVYCCAPIAETFMNVSNIMWYTVPTLVVLICYPAPRNTTVRILEDIFVGLCAVTGPFSIYLFPISVLTIRHTKALERPVLLLIGMIVQICYLTASPRLQVPKRLSHEISNILPFLQGLLTLPTHHPVHILGYVAIYGSDIILAAFALYTVYTLVRYKQYWCLCFLGAVMLQLASMFFSGNLTIAPRYLLLPSLAIAFSLAVTATLPKTPPAARLTSILLVALFLYSSDQGSIPRLAPRWGSQMALYRFAPLGTIVRMRIAPAFGPWYAALVKK